MVSGYARTVATMAGGDVHIVVTMVGGEAKKFKKKNLVALRIFNCLLMCLCTRERKKKQEREKEKNSF